jgi:hypothetical protein
MSKRHNKKTRKPILEQKSTHFALEHFITGHWLTIVIIICIIAAARIFLFSAAYPPFNNIDEPSHFDLVYRYSQSDIPSGLEDFSNLCREIRFVYHSPEYMSPPSDFPNNNYPPPLWSIINKQQLDQVRQMVANSQNAINHESTQPPMYYFLAGQWLKLGMFIGLSGGQLLYWLRFMNVLIYIMTMLAAYIFVKRFYPQNSLIQLGVLAILAVFPQDVFYSINNDILSALLFTLALYCLLETYTSKCTSWFFTACTGLLVAATMLTKFANVAITVGFAIALSHKAWIIWSGRKIKKTEGAIDTPNNTYLRPGKLIVKLAVLVITAVLPIALWMIRCNLLMDDWTGSGIKASYLGWELKPFAQICHHPIFTWQGCGYFLTEVVQTLWRGEICWMGSSLTSAGSDVFYVATTGLFIVAGVISLFKRKHKEYPAHATDYFGLMTIVISLGFLFCISIAYDFGNCFYPSQAKPFLTSGRLLLGVLVPFLTLYLQGFDAVLSILRLSRYKYIALLSLVTAIGIMDTSISLSVFRSQYNWFHML